MTVGDAQGASEGIDSSRRPDPGEHEAGASARTFEGPPPVETAATPVPADHGDRSPESSSRTARSQESAATSGTKWVKAATVATAAGTVMAACAAVGALYFSNSTLSATNDQLGLARQTAQSELLKSAAEQLDSDKESVRLSGVYLLERLAQDSAADQPTVRRLLEAFVRTETTTKPCNVPRPEAPVDIQAALDVITKYAALPDPTPRVKLQGACLAHANLYDTQLTGANLGGANLAGAVLTISQLHETNLAGAQLQFSTSVATVFSEANLAGANLTDANLTAANLTGANLWNANLTGTNLRSANLTGAELLSANLTGGDLIGVQLRSVQLNDAHLDNAVLAGADLAGADLTGANLDGANLTDVVYDHRTRWPDAFTPP